nr:ABC transporter permease [Yersinia enterocolitica]
MLTSEFINDIKLSPLASILAITITALGMLSAFLVLLIYLTDKSIERHNNDYSDIYRIETQFNLPNGDYVKSAQVPLPLLIALQNEKNIKNTAYALRLSSNLQVNDLTHAKVDIYAVSPNFFNIINPYQLNNDNNNPYKSNLSQHRLNLTRNEIIITPEFNQQYLHLDNPIGHVITLGSKGQFVIKDMINLHTGSRFNTKAVIAFSPELIDGYHDKRHDWYDMHAYVFITMAAGEKPSHEQLDALVTHYAPQLPGAPFSPEEFIQLSARNITDIHYDNGLPDEISTVIAKPYLYTLYAAGVFIFITTIINFFNINNVINNNKKNSFQIKKSIGASRYQLLTESFSIAMLQTFFVLLLTILFLIILIPLSLDIRDLILTQDTGILLISFLLTLIAVYTAILFAHFIYLYVAVFPEQSGHHNIYNEQPITGILLISFLLTLIAVYTAILFAHFIYLYVAVFPEQSGHHNIYNEQPISRYIHRVTLCIQTAISGIIIYLWAGMLTQNSFMQHHDFGYEKENILTFPLSDELINLSSLINLQDELKNTSNIEFVSLSSWQPFDMSRSNTSIYHLNQQEKDKLVTVSTLNVNKHFPDTWGMKVLAGQENVLISSEDNNVIHAIVTQSFMTLMGLSSYDETLNSIFYIKSNNAERKVRILRVVNDFYLADRDKNATPLLIYIEDKTQRYGALKLQDMQDIGAIKKTLERYRVTPTQIQTVSNLHKEYFNNSRLIQQTANSVTLVSILLILISIVLL